MMNKKAELAWENIVKALLALIILAVVLGVFYLLFRPAIDGIFGIETESKQSGGGIIEDIRNMFGGSCEGKPPKCNKLSGYCSVCEDGEWETDDSKVCSVDTDC
ncbi:hypothetical protein JXC34_05655 [Candidatus Woesearchaeota archaeon]|nr:hypothetical protein [Candidatus Woesearchaeota archaeon]